MKSVFCEVHQNDGALNIADRVMRRLPEGVFSKILIKPNWVKHQENANFPIEALVTSSDIIDAVVTASLEKYPTLQEITVGDVPLQSCQWDILIQQAGIDRLIEKYRRYNKPRVRFLDLRRERVNVRTGYIEKGDREQLGDAHGYKEVQLDSSSFLDSISDDQNRFRVSDYDPEKTTSSHHRGFHRYLICNTALESELFINVPKMKTHQKSGITGALKNLVGINGEKAYLVHYRQGDPKAGGDEFPPGTPWPVILQTRIREVLQKKSKLSFRLARYAWALLRRVYGIQIEGTPRNLKKRFYSAAGSWYGNDSIWRMVYDLNKIIRYCPREGNRLAERPQREYIAIMDGIVAGEGNGPLQPLCVPMGRILIANDPFLMDMVIAKLAGFDNRKIPLLNRMPFFADTDWGAFDPQAVPIALDSSTVVGISNVPIVHRFAPPPGWKGHIELAARENEREAVPVL